MEQSLDLNRVQYAASIFNAKKGIPLRLDNRPYIWPIYNDRYPRVLLLGGRQIEKTTTQIVLSLIDNIQIEAFKNLYIAPLKEQATKVSKNQWNDIVKSSEYVNKCLVPINSIMDKAFINDSKFSFAYAQLDADRIRSQTADRIIYDEVQDIHPAVFPVADQTITHSKYGFLIFSGTSKSEAHMTHYYWKKSTGYQWAVKCPHCARYQFMTPKNIGGTGPICCFCKMPLTIHDILDKHVSAWIATENESALIKGYRINQLMNPDIVRNWDKFMFELELTQDIGGEEAIQNEIFGFPYGHGERPFSEKMLRELSNWVTPEKYKEYINSPGVPGNTYMGIDWGAENAFTSVTVIGYPRSPNECVTLHHEVFDEYRDEEPQLRRISQLVRQFKPRVICPDAGMGWDRNQKLSTMFRDRVKPIYYSSSTKSFITYHKGSGAFTVNRTRAMSQVIDDLKEKRIKLPPWSEWGKWVGHYLSIFRSTSGTSHTGYKIIFGMEPGKNDDLFHSLVFARMAFNIGMGRFIDIDPDTKRR